MPLPRPLLLALPAVLLGRAAAEGATAEGPCDILAAAQSPCVAAHSMTRALYASYGGPLYLLRRASDNTTRVIGARAGFADAAAQSAFCPPSTVCTVERIFDQSPRGNHLDRVVIQPLNLHGWPVTGINAMREEISVGGHPVFGAYFEAGQDNIRNSTGSGTMGFRCNEKNGTAVADEPETIYAVVSGTHYNSRCCFVRLAPRMFPPPAQCRLLQPRLGAGLRQLGDHGTPAQRRGRQRLPPRHPRPDGGDQLWDPEQRSDALGKRGQPPWRRRRPVGDG